MKLFVNTSDREKIVIGLGKDKIVKPATQDKSQKLLKTIDNELKKRKLTLKDITGIKIVRGPGSFTGLRVGMAVANTLAWVLDIPINNKDVKKDGCETPDYTET